VHACDGHPLVHPPVDDDARKSSHPADELVDPWDGRRRGPDPPGGLPSHATRAITTATPTAALLPMRRIFVAPAPLHSPLNSDLIILPYELMLLFFLVYVGSFGPGLHRVPGAVVKSDEALRNKDGAQYERGADGQAQSGAGCQERRASHGIFDQPVGER
jgi:hypothetical protein